MSIDTNTLAQELQELIVEHKQKYPHLSDKAIAGKTMDRATVNRARNGKKIRKGKALEIIKAIFRGKSLDQMIDLTSGEIKKLLLDTAETVYSSNHQNLILPSDHDQYFQDKSTYKITMLAHTVHGVSEAFIKEEFGNDGLRIFNQMKEDGILYQIAGQNSDQWFASPLEKDVNFSQQAVRDLAVNLLQNSYQVKDWDRGRRRLTIQWESINYQKVMPQISNILKNAYAEIAKVCGQKENHGKDTFYALMNYDLVCNSQAVPEEQHNLQ